MLTAQDAYCLTKKNEKEFKELPIPEEILEMINNKIKNSIDNCLYGCIITLKDWDFKKYYDINPEKWIFKISSYCKILGYFCEVKWYNGDYHLHLDWSH